MSLKSIQISFVKRSMYRLQEIQEPDLSTPVE